MLSAAAVVYVLAAWAVAPGFYDCCAPPQPYNWTCPPPQAGANSKPRSGHLDIKVINGKSDANSVYTPDGQIVIGFLPDAFDATAKSSISVGITPLDTCPQPPRIRFVTNIYKITADAPLKQTANLTMVYSNVLPDPSDIYRTDDPNGPWESLGHTQQAQLFTISITKVTKFGYFAAGYASTSLPPGGVPVLPIIVAVPPPYEGLVVLDRFEERAAFSAAILKRHRLGAEQ